MKKAFNRFAIFTILLLTFSLIFSCFGKDDDKDDDEDTSYKTQAHFLLVNSAATNIASLTFDGDEQLTTPLLPDYAYYVYWESAISGGNISITPSGEGASFFPGQDIALGEILIFEYNGGAAVDGPYLEDIADWIDDLRDWDMR